MIVSDALLQDSPLTIKERDEVLDEFDFQNLQIKDVLKYRVVYAAVHEQTRKTHMLLNSICYANSICF
jgi:hypothetical protein